MNESDGRRRRKPISELKCVRLHVELTESENAALREMSAREFLSLGAMVRKLIRERGGKP